MALTWLVLWLYPRIRLNGYEPLPVKPGNIDLVAIRRESGYKIIVSNGIAHLVEIQGQSEAFDAPDESAQTQDAARLPIRETLKAMQGDLEALGRLVMSVNKIKDEDLPAKKVIWTSEDITKALNGDQTLKSKLEKDLNTRIDGVPLDSVSLEAILNGIVVDSPVSIKVPMEGSTKTVVCRIQEPYKTVFAGSIERKINERFNITEAALLGFYRDEANKILTNKSRKEDVASNLRSLISSEALQQKAVGPERILANTRVLINESLMAGASFVPFEGPNRSVLCNITLKLKDDGRMRLWKYSHENPGFQLLLTVDGVAIAAPVIKTELAESEIQLTRVPSKELVEDAVGFINKTATGKK